MASSPTFSQLLSTEQPQFTEDELSLFESVKFDQKKMGKAAELFVHCAGLPKDGKHILDEDGVGRLIDAMGVPASSFKRQFYQALSRGRPIDFRSALMGMVAMDPQTPHNLGEMACNVRLKYMFAFYDKDGDKLLNPAEMKEILKHGRLTRGQEVNDQILEDAYRELERGISSPAPDTPLPFPTFCKAVYEGKLRGTSTLFRTRYSCDQALANLNSSEGGSGSASGSGAGEVGAAAVPAPAHGRAAASAAAPAAAAAPAKSQAPDVEPMSSGALAELKASFKPHEADFLSECRVGDDELQNFWKRFVVTAGRGATHFTPETLQRLLIRLGVADAADSAEAWFRAMDRDRAGFVDLRQAVLGFAAADPGTAHNIGGVPFQMRLAYIFAFFNKKGDGTLDRQDIKAIVAAGKRLKGEDVTPESLDRGTRDLVERLGGKDRLTLEQLYQYVSNGTIRGTSQLFRVRAYAFK